MANLADDLSERTGALQSVIQCGGSKESHMSMCWFKGVAKLVCFIFFLLFCECQVVVSIKLSFTGLSYS